MSRRVRAPAAKGQRRIGRHGLLALAAVTLVASGTLALVLLIPGPRTEPPVGTGLGQRAPGFSVSTLDGDRVTLASLEGKPAVIWFTAAYCLPCQEGALTLGRILDDLGPDRLRVVMVFVDPTESDAEIAAWRDRYGRPGWTYARGDLAVIRAYDVSALDTKLLLDAAGIVRAGDSFPLREDVWRPAIETVVQG